MDRLSAITLFSQLKQEAESLARRETFLTREFWLWHDRTRQALENVFGRGTEEVHEFQGITFELDSNLLDTTEPTMRTVVQDLDPAANSIDLSVNQQHIYQQGLARAKELLLAIILDLEQPLS
jgi:hypothetical protein